MTRIVLSNKSTAVDNITLTSYASAISLGLSRYFCPTWTVSVPTIVVLQPGSSPQPGDWVFTLVDHAPKNMQGVLGYHDIATNLLPIATIYAADVIADRLSLSVTLFHEIVEALMDEQCNRLIEWDAATCYALEMSDPVEADALGFKINGVLLSNFVTPAWFIPGASGPYDICRRLTGPGQIAAGGYVSVRKDGSGWTQVTAESAPGVQSRIKYAHRHRRRIGHLAEHLSATVPAAVLANAAPIDDIIVAEDHELAVIE